MGEDRRRLRHFSAFRPGRAASHGTGLQRGMWQPLSAALIADPLLDVRQGDVAGRVVIGIGFETALRTDEARHAAGRRRLAERPVEARENEAASTAPAARITRIDTSHRDPCLLGLVGEKLGELAVAPSGSQKGPFKLLAQARKVLHLDGIRSM